MNNFTKYILFSLLLNIGQNAFAQYKKVPLDSINEDIKERVTDFAFKLYNAKSKYELPFIAEDNATTYFIEYYKNLKFKASFPENYGEINRYQLIEVWQAEKGYQYFRYRFGFEYTKRSVEVQVVLTQDNNFTGVIAREAWKKKFHPASKNIKLQQRKISSIDKVLLKKYKDFAFNAYSDCKESKSKEDKAHNWNLANGNKLMAKECDSIKSKLGNFKDLSLIKVLGDRATKYIYRYKISFEALKEVSEVRVYANIYNEFSGIFVINKWYDKYYTLSKAIKKSKEDLGN